jgi:hypothetical protein
MDIESLRRYAEQLIGGRIGPVRPLARDTDTATFLLP